MFNLTTIFNAAKAEKIIELQQQIIALQQINKTRPIKVPFKPNKLRHGLSKKSGMYAMYHIPTKQYMYAGISNNIANRKGAHWNQFKNKGEVVAFYDKKGKQTSISPDSIFARKAYKFDRNADNWEIHAYPMPKALAETCEEMFAQHHNCAFNDSKMLGV